MKAFPAGELLGKSLAEAVELRGRIVHDFAPLGLGHLRCRLSALPRTYQAFDSPFYRTGRLSLSYLDVFWIGAQNARAERDGVR
jgi:hypothetical protein